jgi:hypothetical protein
MIGDTNRDVDAKSAKHPTNDAVSETDARFFRAVEDLLDAQIAAAGGYVEGADPERLPTVVFSPGWPL